MAFLSILNFRATPELFSSTDVPRRRKDPHSLQNRRALAIEVALRLTVIFQADEQWLRNTPCHQAFSVHGWICAANCLPLLLCMLTPEIVSLHHKKYFILLQHVVHQIIVNYYWEVIISPERHSSSTTFTLVLSVRLFMDFFSGYYKFVLRSEVSYPNSNTQSLLFPQFLYPTWRVCPVFVKSKTKHIQNSRKHITKSSTSWSLLNFLH
jgi:hypothetical protein